MAFTVTSGVAAIMEGLKRGVDLLREARLASRSRAACDLEKGQSETEAPGKPVKMSELAKAALDCVASSWHALLRFFNKLRTGAQAAEDELEAVPLARDDLEMQGGAVIGFTQGSEDEDRLEDQAGVVEEVEPGVSMLEAVDGHSSEEDDHAIDDEIALADDDLQVQGEIGMGFDKGSRDHMEDRALVVDDIEPGVRLLAAIDGHGGEEAAEYVASNLAAVVRQASPWPFHSRSEVQERFRWLFCELDRLLLEVLQEKGEFGSAGLSAGCVLSVALQRGSRLFVGSLGDCKVICEPAEGSPYLLTGNPSMHHPDFPSEFRRLQKLGVQVSPDKTVYGLAVSRTLGDFWGATWTKPIGLSIEPYVTSVSLQGTVTLVVSTDGLDTDEPNACVKIRKQLRNGASPEAAALALAKEMGRRELSDNVGIIVVMFKRPEPLKPSSDRPNRFAARRAFKLDFSAAEKKPEDDASTAQASTNGGERDKKAEL